MVQNTKIPKVKKEHVQSSWQDFRDFAFEGNIVDLGIGIVIGTAFKQLTTSFVENIVMPPIGMLLGSVDFSQLFVSLNGMHYDSLDAARAASAPTLNYGMFLTSLIDFFLVALSIYVVIRFVLRKPPKSKAK